MILRTNLPEKRTGLAGGLPAFAAMVLKVLRDGMEARAGAIRGAQDRGPGRRGRK
ncbi:MAG: hypothetical protein J7530_06770 [Novosphingobium sp.]|nr:hypothetical protein [Novosphingobium sp.]